VFHAFTSVHHIYSMLACLSVISVIITCNLNAPCIHVSSSHLLYARLLVSHLCHYNTQSQCSMHSRQFITSTLRLLACQSFCHYNTQSQCSMHSRQFITSTLRLLACQSFCHYNTQSQCSMHSRQFITSTLCLLACQSSLSLWHSISMFHAFTSVHNIYSMPACLSVISVIMNTQSQCSMHSRQFITSTLRLLACQSFCHYNTQSHCSMHSHQFITSTLCLLACQSSLSL